jgi:translation initiation factor 5A
MHIYIWVIFRFALIRNKNCGECMSRPVDVGELRVGGYMMIDGEPCRIMDIAKSKPGKHGSAKARIVAIGVFDGQKRQFVKPVDLGAEIPIIDKRTGQVFAINPNGVQLMDLETYEYLDAPFPDEPELKTKLVAGAEVEYWKIFERIKLVRVK